jgi:hypothetical protein
MNPIVATSAGILEQTMGAMNRVGIGLLYRNARLHRLAEQIPRIRFLGFKNTVSGEFVLQSTRLPGTTYTYSSNYSVLGILKKLYKKEVTVMVV